MHLDGETKNFLEIAVLTLAKQLTIPVKVNLDHYNSEFEPKKNWVMRFEDTLQNTLSWKEVEVDTKFMLHIICLTPECAFLY